MRLISELEKAEMELKRKQEGEDYAKRVDERDEEKKEFKKRFVMKTAKEEIGRELTEEEYENYTSKFLTAKKGFNLFEYLKSL